MEGVLEKPRFLDGWAKQNDSIYEELQSRLDTTILNVLKNYLRENNIEFDGRSIDLKEFKETVVAKLPESQQLVLTNLEKEIHRVITNSLSVSDHASPELYQIRNRLKKVEVVPLDDNRILSIVITDRGIVQHKILSLPDKVSNEDVKKTVELINKLVVGTPINEVSEKLEYEVKPIIRDYVNQYEALYNTFYDAFHEFTTEKNNTYFGGRTNMLKQPEFNSIDKVKEILSKFEDADSISKMKEDDSGINIYVGSETELMDDVSVIKTKYNVDGEEGTIAIIGPKRMEYGRVVALLDYIKNNLGGNDE